jgi:hypothetical protein
VPDRWSLENASKKLTCWSKRLVEAKSYLFLSPDFYYSQSLYTPTNKKKTQTHKKGAS